MTLWLVGMMGAGKTTVGQLAADALNKKFFDTDQEIARRMGCSVAQLWGELGEGAFRDVERATIARLADSDAVVSAGGGAPVDPSNRAKISLSGRCVWLKADPAILSERLEGGEDRPLLLGHDSREEALRQVLSDRAAFYEDVADHEIETNSVDPASVAAEIVRWWST